MSQENRDRNPEGSKLPDHQESGGILPQRDVLRSAKRGRPRSEKVKEAILAAAKHLAQSTNRYRDLTMQGIAAEAKVSKATVYRWWKSKGELVRDACLVDHMELPNTGTLLGDLCDLVKQQSKVFEGNASYPVVAGAWAELVEQRVEADFAPATFQCPLGQQVRQLISEIFEAARARQEWHGVVNSEAVYDYLFGVTFYRVVGRFRKFEDSDAKHLAENMISVAGTQQGS